MATMEELVRAALISFSEVTDLVGTSTSARIRADNLKQDETLPAIIVEVDDERYPNDLTGTSGRMYAGVNLVCRDTTRKKARALATAVRLNGTDPGTGLHGYGGTVLSTVLDAWLEYIALSRTPREDKSDRYWYDANMMFACTALVTV